MRNYCNGKKGRNIYIYKLFIKLILILYKMIIKLMGIYNINYIIKIICYILKNIFKLILNMLNIKNI